MKHVISFITSLALIFASLTVEAPARADTGDYNVYPFELTELVFTPENAWIEDIAVQYYSDCTNPEWTWKDPSFTGDVACDRADASRPGSIIHRGDTVSIAPQEVYQMKCLVLGPNHSVGDEGWYMVVCEENQGTPEEPYWMIMIGTISIYQTYDVYQPAVYPEWAQ